MKCVNMIVLIFCLSLAVLGEHSSRIVHVLGAVPKGYLLSSGVLVVVEMGFPEDV